MRRHFEHLRPAAFLFLFTILQSFSSFARDYVYQSPATEQTDRVRVVNQSKDSQGIWVLFYQDEFIEEHYFDVPALSQKIVKLDGIKKPNWNFAILTKSALVFPVADSATGLSSWNRSSTTTYEMNLKTQKSMTINFLNLYTEKQKITLKYLNTKAQILKSFEFYSSSFRKSISRWENFPSGTARLVIESEAPIQVSHTDLALSAGFIPKVATSRVPSAGFKYFLVQGGSEGTSFVAPINDPEQIARAREEISNPQGYILFADIELNTAQANRNFSGSDKPYWSWSVKKVTGFAQIGADWCQAYPEMIERMIHALIRQRSVCFRGQRVVRELSLSEVQSGRLSK